MSQDKNGRLKCPKESIYFIKKFHLIFFLSSTISDQLGNGAKMFIFLSHTPYWISHEVCAYLIEKNVHIYQSFLIVRDCWHRLPLQYLLLAFLCEWRVRDDVLGWRVLDHWECRALEKAWGHGWRRIQGGHVDPKDSHRQGAASASFPELPWKQESLSAWVFVLTRPRGTTLFLSDPTSGSGLRFPGKFVVEIFLAPVMFMWGSMVVSCGGPALSSDWEMHKGSIRPDGRDLISLL